MSARILIRGGTVLTLGERTANFSEADVLIEDGLISEVGPGLRGRDAEVIDATDSIVMPGFIDTHRHTWKSLFRNFGPIDPGVSVPVDVSRFSAEDLYASVLIGLLGATEAGITTVVDWSDIPSDPALSEAVVQAHIDSGVRTVLVAEPRRDGELDFTAIEAICADVSSRTDALITTAVGGSSLGPGDSDRTATEWESAKRLGLRVHVHAGMNGDSPTALSELASRGVLDDNVTLVHCSRLSDTELDSVREHKPHVSLTPVSEMTRGLGSPPIQELIDRGIRPGLGVDDDLSSPGDMFAQMRALISLQHATLFDLKLAGKAGVPQLMSTREVLRHATVDAARVAGLAGVAGSLEPGRGADVLVLRTDRPNIAPVNDPIGAVVWGMDTSNIDHVIVAGRPVLTGGKLVADTAHLSGSATEARDRVVASGGLVGGAA